jgi:hypothetical protein
MESLHESIARVLNETDSLWLSRAGTDKYNYPQYPMVPALGRNFRRSYRGLNNPQDANLGTRQYPTRRGNRSPINVRQPYTGIPGFDSSRGFGRGDVGREPEVSGPFPPSFGALTRFNNANVNRQPVETEYSLYGRAPTGGPLYGPGSSRNPNSNREPVEVGNPSFGRVNTRRPDGTMRDPVSRGDPVNPVGNRDGQTTQWGGGEWLANWLNNFPTSGTRLTHGLGQSGWNTPPQSTNTGMPSGAAGGR